MYYTVQRGDTVSYYYACAFTTGALAAQKCIQDTEILYLLLYIDVKVTASDLVSALRRLLTQSRSQESLQLDTKQA